MSLLIYLCLSSYHLVLFSSYQLQPIPYNQFKTMLSLPIVLYCQYYIIDPLPYCTIVCMYIFTLLSLCLVHAGRMREIFTILLHCLYILSDYY